MSKQLSTWIRTGVVEENIKDTLDSTLNALLIRSSVKVLQRISRYSAGLKIKNCHLPLLSSTQPKQSRQSKPFAIFKKTRLHSSAVGQHVTITHNYKENRTVRDSSPSVLQSFSFTENEQGAVIEPFVNLVEKAIYEFLVKNESTIPLEVVENFCSK
ncbi:44462_t:CDS:2 [Gigaspora margarita]|uniref:44462_t:CDS:1 n=1 Tax=Gigaspora margarita TaxID=4874 RepID=A0ABN7WBN1_GIGMA|nr:44462_t:CDS:2 [Gigaspora margarita]